jgi:hypothetical protein
MERTYRDMNLGSVLDLRDFYSNFVVGRYEAIRKDCETLIEDCHNLEVGQCCFNVVLFYICHVRHS